MAISFVGFISLSVLLAAGSFLPRRWQHRSQASCQYKVCAIQFDIHTNILVPVYTDSFDWRNHLPLPLHQQQYLGFGWGDRNWYMNPPTELSDTLSRGLQAMFFSDASVLGIQAYDRLPTQNIKCVGVTRSDYLKLMEFLQNAMQRNQQGEVIQLSNHPPTQTNYFKAIGHYSILHNSNHWTAEGLDTVQINTPLWAGFSFAIMRQIEATCL
ncbi:DUF2459 domain-containing protein [Microcoleus sp. FACHB-1515]|uniref:DUF2459 domain-containing protein n=1 Tax=Cyanophyceae TaxID=3028117 RepID=UPI00168956B4|nr:DUF2459 domain-containing protein [Microcoleus sp. FACHB-1515]MBD2090243.1 DUF2459 domain-containing protein [Microcoleus sp. FACHB-1515]